MSLIINFFGGPGMGKSSKSAGLFSEMKKHHMDVELTYEFPKIVAWDENFSAIKDQFFITANQHRNISRLYGKVNYIIVDSPILLGLIYKKRYVVEECYPSSFYDDSFDTFIINLFKKYNSLNIMLNRNDDFDSYNELGRFQKLEESRKIDDEIKNKLIENNIPFIDFPVNESTHIDIFNYIIKNKL